MMDYVVKHQPPIVILENVSNAPWDEVVERFEKIGYDATYIRLDTKYYYIPHTRSRGCKHGGGVLFFCFVFFPR